MVASHRATVDREIEGRAQSVDRRRISESGMTATA